MITLKEAEPLLTFIFKRELVRQKKEAGYPWPWTDDPILQQYRFCNVRRNDDLQTRLIHANWLNKPAQTYPDAWFVMCVARLVNWWPTLERMWLPVPWDPTEFCWAVALAKEETGKAYTGAYMVRADKHPGGKAQYHADKVLTPLWGDREHYRPRRDDTLDSFHQRLMGAKDFGSFLAAQVVADLKYEKGLGGLSKAKDWETWAASGPGSRRGLNRVMKRPVDCPWKEPEWRKEFASLLSATSAHHGLTGQDLQNCLCEFDKHERVRLGEGRPRSKYSPPATVTKEPK